MLQFNYKKKLIKGSKVRYYGFIDTENAIDILAFISASTWGYAQITYLDYCATYASITVEVDRALEPELQSVWAKHGINAILGYFE